MDWSIALADAATLRSQGMFLAEGRLVLSRILAGAAGGPDAIVAVLATPAGALALALESRISDRLTIRTPAEMEALTGFNFHRGVLALVRRPAVVDVAELIEMAVGTVTRGVTAASVMDASARRPYPPPGGAKADGRLPKADVGRRLVVVVAEHLVDVDNVGSVFRNARAFGAACVLLDDRCPDPLYRKAVRTSLGHVLEIPWARASIAEILAALDAHGVATVGLTPQTAGNLPRPIDLSDLASRLDSATPVAVVVGNEGSGVSAETMTGCTHLARIPMAEGADSLNVATALAVALYELTCP